MRPSEIEQAIAVCFKARKPLLIEGPPGCGKSNVVEQAASRMNAKLLVSHPAVEDPVDPKGFPKLLDDHATFVPFGTLYEAIHATGPTVWFLDDFGQAIPAVQAAYMQLLLSRRLNGYILSDDVWFALASNRQEDKAGAHRIITPVADRVFRAAMEVSHDDWQRWAVTSGVHANVRAFHNFTHGTKLFDFDPLRPHNVTPRGWADVSTILDDCPDSIRLAMVTARIGAAMAAEFESFLSKIEMLKQFDPKQILKAADTFAIPEEASVLYALEGALVDLLRADGKKVAGPFAAYVSRWRSKEIATKAVIDACSCLPTFASTPELQTWLKDNKSLLTGK